MHNSIENRSPFLDSKLFETSLKIPTQYLIKSGRAKSVLRDAMKNIVPDQILDSYRKVGFNAPIEGLLDTKDKAIKESILDNSSIYEIVKRKNIEEILNQDKITNETSKFLFSFLGTKIFLENFNR
jgi:asparagine synthase (glutamine-hydrolysing)